MNNKIVIYLNSQPKENNNSYANRHDKGRKGGQSKKQRKIRKTNLIHQEEQKMASKSQCQAIIQDEKKGLEGQVHEVFSTLNKNELDYECSYHTGYLSNENKESLHDLEDENEYVCQNYFAEVEREKSFSNKIVQSQEMMANDLIEQEGNFSCIGSDEHLKQLSNPQEESYEEQDSKSRTNDDQLLKESMKDTTPQSKDYDVPLEQSQSVIEPSSKLISPKLPRNAASRKYERKDRKKSTSSIQDSEIKAKNGRWTMMEHVRFLEALKTFGKNWKKVEEYVATRTSTQARSHAQKFFANIIKNNMTMEQFLDGISQETLNHLKRIAQRSQDPREKVEEMGEPEILKLLMMHMSKNNHDEEVQGFEELDSVVELVEETSQLEKEATNLKRKKVGRSKISQQLSEHIGEEEQEKSSKDNDREIDNYTKSQHEQDSNMFSKSNDDPIHLSMASTGFQQSGVAVFQEEVFAQNSLIGNTQNTVQIKTSFQSTTKVTSHLKGLSNDLDQLGMLPVTAHSFSFGPAFNDLTPLGSNKFNDAHDFHQQNHSSAMTNIQLDANHHTNPFMHLADNTPSNRFGISEAFALRSSRMSQDFISLGASGVAMNVRSSRCSSFDLNDCFAKENVEDIMGDGQKGHHSYSLFKKPQH